MSSKFVVALVSAVALVVAGCGSSSHSSGNAAFGKGVSAARIALRLKADGMPIGKMQAYNASTDPNSLLGRPGQYTSKVSFRDKRIKNPVDPSAVSAGGSVEVFKSASDAKNRADYVRSITQAGGLFAEYSYLRDLVFLRLSKELTPQQAKQYEQALRRL